MTVCGPVSEASATRGSILADLESVFLSKGLAVTVHTATKPINNTLIDNLIAVDIVVAIEVNSIVTYILERLIM